MSSRGVRWATVFAFGLAGCTVALMNAYVTYLQRVAPVDASTGALGSFVRSNAVALGLVDFGFFCAAPVICVAAMACLAFRRTRAYGGVALAVLVLGAGAWVAAGAAGGRRWWNALSKCVENSDVLVNALAQYDAAEGHPAVSLEALVPRYLPKPPRTGLIGYPEYEYLSGEQVAQKYGNPWILRLRVPVSASSWDVLVYFPNQDYPSYIDGYPATERMGRWRVVHGS